MSRNGPLSIMTFLLCRLERCDFQVVRTLEIYIHWFLQTVSLCTVDGPWSLCNMLGRE